MSKLLNKLAALRNSRPDQKPGEVPKPKDPIGRPGNKRVVSLSVLIVLAGCYGLFGLYQKKKNRMDPMAGKTKTTEEILTELQKNSLLGLESKNFDAAIDGFEKIAALAPDKTEPLINLAYAAKKKGDFEKAEKTLLRAIEKTPKNAVVYNNLGLVYLEKKDYEKAAQSLTDALKVDPSFVTSVLNLAYLYEEKKEWKKAVGFYEQYLNFPEEGKEHRATIRERVRRLHSYAVKLEGKS